MECISKGEPGYDEARKIGNARFDLFPEVVCYCGSEDGREAVEDVREALERAHKEKLPVRIRSGGHHHEGMCSADRALIVDVSRLNGITFHGDEARIGPGAKLADVYAAMGDRKMLFPGGGCGDVRVGGLVQGGGWGPYSRQLGLTCDQLVGFDLVRAGGELVRAGEGDHQRLLWAVRGAGGGNFGVVTQFRFRLARQETRIESFSLTWDDARWIGPVVDEWRRSFPDDARRELTTFCRVAVVGGERDQHDVPVSIGGRFLGEWSDLEAHLPQLLPKTFASGVLKRLPAELAEASPGLLPGYQPGPPLAGLRAAYPGVADEDLQNTCAGIPHRHKVSSSFPSRRFLDGSEAVAALGDYIAGSKPEPAARLYLSLHCLGGVIAEKGPEWSCFAFRDKPFMLQYQAWWAGSDPQVERRSIDWVRGFREQMAPYTEGAFINFPDRDLAGDRRELLRYYYGGNLDGLIDVKRRYDPDDFFNFGMSLP